MNSKINMHLAQIICYVNLFNCKQNIHKNDGQKCGFMDSCVVRSIVIVEHTQFQQKIDKIIGM
jgi:hypothetical protein